MLIIADAGDSASLVVLDELTTPGPGSRFEHDGRTWEIRLYRPSAKAWVASPTGDFRH